MPAPGWCVGDRVVVEAGEVIPGDGDVVEGVASVDESAITGESAPVIREAGGDRSAVTGGTRVLSDRIVVRITAAAGETFLDKMIALVEGTSRRKTPNEIALSILLASLTLVFLAAVATLAPMAAYAGAPQDVVVLVALLVCLIPTTIGALLSAIGIAGMDRLVRVNVLAMSGRAVEAAGDVSTLLLDKTGTITYGNRQASRFVAGAGRRPGRAARHRPALQPGRPDARGSLDRRARPRAGRRRPRPARRARRSSSSPPRPGCPASTSPTAREVRKGAGSAIAAWLGVEQPAEVHDDGRRRSPAAGARRWSSVAGPAARGQVLGVVHLKDVVKEGMAERFAELRAMGIRTVMITGDNPLTAQAIAAEAGVDDFLAEATPEDKMAYIHKEQEGGRLVAMTGDGTNDAPRWPRPTSASR